MNMKFKGKGKSRAGRLPDNVPLIELHHYSRLSDSEPDLGYTIPTTRHIGFRLPSSLPPSILFPPP